MKDVAASPHTSATHTATQAREPMPTAACLERKGLDIPVISALAPEFKAAGVRLNSWWPDYASGMRILYTSDTPEIPRSLVEKLEIYGPGTVTFEVGSVVSLADFRADIAPFRAGG